MRGEAKKMTDLDKKVTFRLKVPHGRFETVFTLRELGYSEEQSIIEIKNNLWHKHEEWMLNNIQSDWELED